jgi:hypothetical protein
MLDEQCLGHDCNVGARVLIHAIEGAAAMITPFDETINPTRRTSAVDQSAHVVRRVQYVSVLHFEGVVDGR